MLATDQQQLNYYQLIPDYINHSGSQEQNRYDFLSSDSSPQEPQGLSFAFDNNACVPVAQMVPNQVELENLPNGSRRRVRFQPQPATIMDDSDHSIAHHRQFQNNPTNQTYHHDFEEESPTVYDQQALIPYDIQSESDDYFNHDAVGDRTLSDNSALFLEQDDDSSTGSGTIYPYPNMSETMAKPKNDSLVRVSQGRQSAHSQFTPPGTRTRKNDNSFQSQRIAHSRANTSRVRKPKTKLSFFQNVGQKLPRAKGDCTNFTSSNNYSSRKRLPEHDPENHLIKRLRTESHMPWAEIVKVLNEQRVKEHRPATFTEAAVYGRFVRNAPRIAASLGEQGFDPKDWMHLRPVKNHTVQRGGTDGRDDRVSRGMDEVGGHLDKFHHGPAGNNGMDNSMSFTSEDDAALMDAYGEAYEQLSGRMWEIVADKLDEKCGKGFDAETCAKRFEYI